MNPNDIFYIVRFTVSINEYNLPSEVTVSFGVWAPGRDTAIARAARMTKELLNDHGGRVVKVVVDE